jgi:superfamily II DNA or RNA helicase
VRLDEALRNDVPARVRERGDDYFARGRVVSARPAEEGILCEVEGGSRYVVELVPSSDVLFASCDCRHFADTLDVCKHIWASVREVSRRGLLNGDFVSFGIRRPRRRRTTPRPERSRPVRRWESFFDALPRFAPPGRTTDPPDDLLFVVSTWTLAPPSVEISVRERHRKKSGEWSRAKAYVPSSDHLRSLDRQTREILLLLDPGGYEVGGRTEFRPRASAAAVLIRQMAEAGKLYLEDAVSRDLLGPLRWDEGPAWHLVVEMVRDGAGNYAVDAHLERSGERMPLQEARMLLPGVLLTDSAAAPLEEHDALAWVDALGKAGMVEIPASDRQELLTRLIDAPPGIILPDELSFRETTASCLPILRLDASGEAFSGKPLFRYDEREVRPLDPEHSWIQEGVVVRRDLSTERFRQDQLAALGMTRDAYGSYTVRAATLGPVLERLIEHGWEVELAGRQVRASEQLSWEVVSGIDWFDLEGGATFGDERVALPQLLEAVERRRPVVALEDGSVGILPAEWLSRFETVAALGQKSGDALRFRRSHAMLIDALLAAADGSRERRSITALKAQIGAAEEITPQQESTRFRGVLRPYQREGLGWLRYLASTGFGGCLADDMGLGKTVQVLALLDQLSSEGGRPSLVVAPRSLLFNWKKEAERFTPHLRVLEHHGQERTKASAHFSGYDLVLTTYATLRLDAAHFTATEFEYVILDEAQAIKNATSQASKAVRLLRAAHRVALSGTPVENHIGELWSLFEFLNPGMLGPQRWFHRTFTAKGVPPERRRLLGDALRPLILRRTKQQVAPELPARTEQTIYCELSEGERERYDELRRYYRARLAGEVRTKGLENTKMQVLEALLRLRQAACHPALLGETHNGSSSKVETLLEELREILESGHRALVFSQFTSFLALIREELDREKIPYLYLDGTTRDRASLVERFQDGGGPPLFLISLKAGGLGLNLTAADYVFLLDPWWNPAVEAQAIDRSHRIGQTRPVMAYRLIARDTVEEKILELQASKRELAGAILTDENSILQALDAEQLDSLLS